MIIRGLDKTDIPSLQEIHSKYFAHEFAFEEFLDAQLIQAFACVDDDNNIVAAGGLKNILESVLLTNKDYNIHDRRTALYMILQTSIHMANAMRYPGIHAAIHDTTWSRHLKRVGFRPTKGEMLVLPL